MDHLLFTHLQPRETLISRTSYFKFLFFITVVSFYRNERSFAEMNVAYKNSKKYPASLVKRGEKKAAELLEWSLVTLAISLTLCRFRHVITTEPSSAFGGPS